MPSPSEAAVKAVGVIIPAAGNSRRFGTDKLTLKIDGISVISRSVRVFLDAPQVTSIVIACSPGRMQNLAQALASEERNSPLIHWCEGGDCRARSVLEGLNRLRMMQSPPSLVAVHDAARPAASPGLVERVFTAAREHGAAVPGVPVIDTIKRIAADGSVVGTLPRNELAAVQTPQAMRLDWLADAFERCPIALEEVTDDAQLLELAGRRVRVVEGEATNVKLTLPSDVEQLERILAR